MKNKNVFIVGSFMLLTLGTNAQFRGGHSGGNRPSPDQIIEHLDANNDGKLDISEAEKAPNGHLSQNFNDMDANQDGHIDKDELTNGIQKRKRNSKTKEHRKSLKEMDLNEDGMLDEIELTSAENTHLLNHFSEIDTNSDQLLSKEELKASRKLLKEKKKEKRKGALKFLDTNADGLISRSEAEARKKLNKHFTKIDTNEDGQLSREELKVYRKQKKSQR